MATRRDFPYFWATWLPRLLVGDRSCEWAVWFKAHYVEWTRQPSDFDQAQWLFDHTALLNQQRQEWRARGHRGHVESQNAFRLRGKTAVLAGRTRGSSRARTSSSSTSRPADTAAPVRGCRELFRRRDSQTGNAASSGHEPGVPAPFPAREALPRARRHAFGTFIHAVFGDGLGTVSGYGPFCIVSPSTKC